MSEVLTQEFFERPTLTVARELLGKALVRRYRGRVERVILTEVEAYDGPWDRASHAHRGSTARNQVMFGNPGVWYVYFVYGMHWMLNMVTGPAGYPAAVLLRGGRREDGTPVNGPARLTKFLHVGKQVNGLPARRSSGLWIEDSGIRVPQRSIHRAPRIGVEYAGTWANKPYRFFYDA